MATWPATLPTYGAGLEDTRQAGFIRSPNEVGPPKQRRRYSATARQLSGSMLFTLAQRSTFEVFYQTTINEGADAFDFVDPADGSTVSVRFIEPPAFTHVSGGASGSELQLASIALEVAPS